MKLLFRNANQMVLLLALALLATQRLAAAPEKQLLLPFSDACPLERLVPKPAELEHASGPSFLAWAQKRLADKRIIAFKVNSRAEGGEVWVRGTIMEVGVEGSIREGYNCHHFYLQEAEEGRLPRRRYIDPALVRARTMLIY